MSSESSSAREPGASLLSRLVERQRNPAAALRPVLPSRFEPVDEAGLPNGGHDFGLTEVPGRDARNGARNDARNDARRDTRNDPWSDAGHDPGQAPRPTSRGESRRTPGQAAPRPIDAPSPSIGEPPRDRWHAEEQSEPSASSAPAGRRRRTATPGHSSARSPERVDTEQRGTEFGMEFGTEQRGAESGTGSATLARPTGPWLPDPLVQHGLSASHPEQRARQRDAVRPEAGPLLPEPMVLHQTDSTHQHEAAAAETAMRASRSGAPSEPTEQPITLSVRIGRIEVHIPAPAASDAAGHGASHRSAAHMPRLSLEEYLARPNRGRS